MQPCQAFWGRPDMIRQACAACCLTQVMLVHACSPPLGTCNTSACPGLPSHAYVSLRAAAAPVAMRHTLPQPCRNAQLTPAWCRSHQHVPLEEYAENLKLLIGHVQAYGAKAIIMLTPPPVDEAARVQYNKQVTTGLTHAHLPGHNHEQHAAPCGLWQLPLAGLCSCPAARAHSLTAGAHTGT